MCNGANSDSIQWLTKWLYSMNKLYLQQLMISTDCVSSATKWEELHCIMCYAYCHLCRSVLWPSATVSWRALCHLYYLITHTSKCPPSSNQATVSPGWPSLWWHQCSGGPYLTEKRCRRPQLIANVYFYHFIHCICASPLLFRHNNHTFKNKACRERQNKYSQARSDMETASWVGRL